MHVLFSGEQKLSPSVHILFDLIPFLTTFGQSKVEQKLPAVEFFRLGALPAR